MSEQLHLREEQHIYDLASIWMVGLLVQAP
jgi:hypothetical protein